jgi:HEAT repeat protein
MKEMASFWRTSFLLLLLFLPSFAPAQDDSPKARAKAVKELGKKGSDGVAGVAAFLRDESVEVRVEAVKTLGAIGTQKCLDPLTSALIDPDPEVQIRAMDILADFYVPGYAKDSLSNSLKRKDNNVSGKFPDNSDWIIPAYLQARPEIIASLRQLLKGSGSLLVRSNAARVLGVLRGKPAVPELVDALRSKDDELMYQSIVSIQKVRAKEAAPRLQFLLRDLNEHIQIAAIETVGLLGDKTALPDLRRVLETSPKQKVRRAALGSIAMLPDPANRALFSEYLHDKDDALREAAAEGLGRLANPQDVPAMEATFDEEKKNGPRLSQAFALVAMGKRDLSEAAPLRYLVNNLNTKSWRGVSIPFLSELSRQPEVRRALYPVLDNATRDEKTGLAQALASAGGQDAAPTLESLSRDSDKTVAEEGLRALRTLRAAN